MYRLLLTTIVALLAVPTAPASPSAPPTPEPATEPARPIRYDDLLGIWAYDFDHLASRDDIAKISADGQLGFILALLGRVTWEFTPDHVLYLRAANTLRLPMSPTIKGDTLTTHIPDAQGAVPLTLRLIDDHTLVCSFRDIGEHDSFRFTRLDAPGDELVGRWSGESEDGTTTRAVFTASGRCIIAEGDRRWSGPVDVKHDGAVYNVTVNGDKPLELELTMDAGMGHAELKLGDEPAVTVDRSFDPLGWIEGVWNIDPVATREHPFYQIWPDAFGKEPPTQEPNTALRVVNGRHSDQFPMDVHGVNGNTVIFGVNSGPNRTLIPLRRIDENTLETLVEKLVLHRVSVLELNIRADEQGDHDH